MEKEDCIGEYQADDHDCLACSVVATCKRKRTKILIAALGKWRDTQRVRKEAADLIKKQREYKSMVRQLGQQIGEKQKEEREKLDEYNRFMIGRSD